MTGNCHHEHVAEGGEGGGRGAGRGLKRRRGLKKGCGGLKNGGGGQKAEMGGGQGERGGVSKEMSVSLICGGVKEKMRGV